jgi:hypothetical protein
MGVSIKFIETAHYVNEAPVTTPRRTSNWTIEPSRNKPGFPHRDETVLYYLKSNRQGSADGIGIYAIPLPFDVVDRYLDHCETNSKLCDLTPDNLPNSR